MDARWQRDKDSEGTSRGGTTFPYGPRLMKDTNAMPQHWKGPLAEAEGEVERDGYEEKSMYGSVKHVWIE